MVHGWSEEGIAAAALRTEKVLKSLPCIGAAPAGEDLCLSVCLRVCLSVCPGQNAGLLDGFLNGAANVH